MRKLTAIAAALLAGGVGAAEAHGVHTAGAGLAQGFAHPLVGVDHVLAMVAVGLWAAQLGGRARWIVPAAFVATMAGGAALGMLGVGLPYVEVGIVGSLLVLGALVTVAVRLPVALGAVLVGFFALFHGHAHGTELPEAASAALYAAGFVTATALLHAVGVAAGVALRGELGARVVRVGGAATAAAGVALLVVWG